MEISQVILTEVLKVLVIIGNTGSESGTRDFDGDIAIFSIYDRVLTGSEVTQNYNHFKNRYT